MAWIRSLGEITVVVRIVKYFLSRIQCQFSQCIFYDAAKSSHAIVLADSLSISCCCRLSCVRIVELGGDETTLESLAPDSPPVRNKNPDRCPQNSHPFCTQWLQKKIFSFLNFLMQLCCVATQLSSARHQNSVLFMNNIASYLVI